MVLLKEWQGVFKSSGSPGFCWEFSSRDSWGSGPSWQVRDESEEKEFLKKNANVWGVGCDPMLEDRMIGSVADWF